MHTPARTQTLLCLLSFLAGSQAAFAGAGEEGGVAPTMKDCEQTDSAPLVVRACTAMLKAATEPEERKRLLFLRATGWMKEEDFDAAADDYTAILDIEKDNLTALEGRGNANLKGGAFSQSITDWTRLLELKPEQDRYYRNRGQAQLGAKKFEEALADFEKSIIIAPQEIDAYIGRAQVYSAMGNIEQSKREFERGIAVNDRYLPLFWIRGEMAYEWGDRDLSIASYVRVLEINSLYEDARRRLQRAGILHPP